MKLLNVVILFAFILFWGACTKEAEIQQKEYPFVITKDVENLDFEGVTLVATVLDKGKENITDFGFKWSNGESEFSYSLKDEKAIEDFSFRVTNDFKKNVQYFYRAYIQTSGHLVFGNTVKFLSEGSMSPVINDFSPKEGFDESQIVITGSNFSFNTNNNIVTINGEKAKVIQSSDNSIICLVPKMEFYGETDIRVEVGDNSTVAGSKFKILGPELTNVSSMQGHSGEYIIINGKYFTQNGELTELHFGDQKAEIISISESRINAIVPSLTYWELFEDDSVKIRLTNGLKTTEYRNDYLLETSWEKKTSLYYNASNSKIFTYNNRAFILEQWRPLMHVYNPETNSWKGEPTSEYPHTTEGSLHITIGGEMYLVGGYVFQMNPYKELWTFDISSKTWDRRADLPFSFLSATFYERNSLIYIITDKGEHWRCNFLEEQYTRMKDFPVNFGNSFAHSFVCNNKIFAAVYGRTFQYNEQNDNWIEKNKNPIKNGYYSPHAIGFTYKNFGYIYDTDSDYLYRYDETEDFWIKTCYVPVSLFNHPRISIFILNNKVFFEDVNQNNQYMFVYKN